MHISGACVLLLSVASFRQGDRASVDSQMAYCHSQVERTLDEIKGTDSVVPRSIDLGKKRWSLVNAYDWTSGFWPGILWYVYDDTKDKEVEQAAERYTDMLQCLLSPSHQGDHDLGFQFYCSFGNAYRLTKDAKYKQVLLGGAKKLSGFFNPKVGTILSWPGMCKQMNWPHNTIMDNIMNLELLFWAAKNGGGKQFYDMAESHARVTMKNQFRPDGTCYHVAVYDTISGNFIKGVTNQGYSDDSFWARGQAWAIYGYTMVYRETGNKEYLRFAEKVASVYLDRLPDDRVPYWDFDDPKIPDSPRDASSAAIVASALIELAHLEDSEALASYYIGEAEKMLESLSSVHYRSGKRNPSFLLHSTGNLPGGYEIDASINYADYYYVEALTRYRNYLEAGGLAALKAHVRNDGINLTTNIK